VRYPSVSSFQCRQTGGPFRPGAQIATVPPIGLCKIAHLIEVVVEVAGDSIVPARDFSGIIARVRCWLILLQKRFWASERATLIQDQPLIRNVERQPRKSGELVLVQNELRLRPRACVAHPPTDERISHVVGIGVRMFLAAYARGERPA
jgi:hypothetical protein